MKTVKKLLPYLIGVCFLTLIIIHNRNSDVYISYPFKNTIFPPEFPAPEFMWGSNNEYSGKWSLRLKSDNGQFILDTIFNVTKWRPDEILWAKLKKLANNDEIHLSVKRSEKYGTSKISFSFSTDSVAAPILFRQMPIPFVLAEKELDMMNYVLIDVGSIKAPHIAMKGFQVCGNCHSFSQDGKYIGLDLDAGLRDKGGYFVSPIKDSLIFDDNNYMSWTKIEKRKTFGLFSKISPNGRYIVTTVKDRVVHHNFPYNAETNAFSQLFFPVNGHLAIFDRETKQIHELPGANLDEYVQSNATWTPDGKNIVFCRAKSLPYSADSNEINIDDENVIEEYVQRKRRFQYDICIIPFNNGNGGTAMPIKGAAENRMSNYFPAVSPDGKWLIFCQAENFMLLQPDSKLYIVPIEGGNSRKLECNLPLMNSWHAWSPNSKWIVFVSKGLSVFTDMFLSHIDAEGNASPPVLIEKARQNHKVANYPEFLNVRPDYKFDMVYDYVELAHIEKAIKMNDFTLAKQLYKRYKAQSSLIFEDDLHQINSYLQKLGLKNENEYWLKQLYK